MWGEPRSDTPVRCDRRFQLTRPVWGEPAIRRRAHYFKQISTHSPRVGRTVAKCAQIARSGISTHSPRVGRTCSQGDGVNLYGNFNSLAPCGANPRLSQSPRPFPAFQLTRPVWGEPCTIDNVIDPFHISTHSPRVGRTLRAFLLRLCGLHFNSLAPCGANRERKQHCRHLCHFNSLAPCGANPFAPF